MIYVQISIKYKLEIQTNNIVKERFRSLQSKLFCILPIPTFRPLSPTFIKRS